MQNAVKNKGDIETNEQRKSCGRRMILTPRQVRRIHLVARKAPFATHEEIIAQMKDDIPAIGLQALRDHLHRNDVDSFIAKIGPLTRC